MSLKPHLTLAFNNPDATPAKRHVMCCPGFAAEYVRIESQDAYSYAVTGESHYLALHDIVLIDGEARPDGAPASRARDLRSTISFMPRACGISGWSRPAARVNSFTALYFDPVHLREDLGPRFGSTDLQPLLHIRNPRLAATLAKMQETLASGAPDDLYAEIICMMAAVEITKWGGQIPAGRLSQRQIDTVLAQIDANLVANIRVSDLARSIDLSRFHFARAFKNTIGQSPYNFIVSRRIERAVRMLQVGSAPVEEVARAVGFSSASQFGRAFRKAVGEAPQAFRRKRG
jgi:AraC family transcriptional regulator